MMHHLIISHHSAVHAIAALAALENRDQKASYIPIDIYPFEDKHSIEINQKFCQAYFDFADIKLPQSISSVWFRRRAITRAFDYCEPWTDEDFRRRTISAYAHGLYEWLATAFQDAKWVNAPRAAAAANSKILQLQCAVAAGLHIPDTIISNDPDRIRTFSNRSPETIVKSFIPFAWRNESGKREVALTSEITGVEALSDASLSLQPAIYQRKVRKAFEVRHAVFGDYEFSIKIESQQREETRLDWRQSPPRRSEIAPFEIPDRVSMQCREVMGRLGILSGSFDFICDENGDYVFLEVNEAGQFLWMEELCPELAVLDAFTAFLCGVPRTNWEPVEKNRLVNVQASDAYKDQVQTQKAIVRRLPTGSSSGLQA